MKVADGEKLVLRHSESTFDDFLYCVLGHSSRTKGFHGAQMCPNEITPVNESGAAEGVESVEVSSSVQRETVDTWLIVADQIWFRFLERGLEEDREAFIQIYPEIIVHLPYGHPARQNLLRRVSAVRNATKRPIEDSLQLEELKRERNTKWREIGQLLPAEMIFGPRSGELHQMLSDETFKARVDTLFREVRGITRQILRLASNKRPFLLLDMKLLISSTSLLGFEGSEEDIEIFRDALKGLPHGHPMHPELLGTLAGCLTMRLQQTGCDVHRQEVIKLYQGACQNSNPQFNRSIWLVKFADFYYSQAEDPNHKTDIDKAIALYQEALKVCPEHDLHEVTRKLAVGHMSRFDLTSEPGDHTKAVRLLREALRHQPNGDRDRVATLLSLADALARRRHVGDVESVSEAITIYRKYHTADHRGFDGSLASLMGLTHCLFSRHSRTGNLMDLLEGMTLLRKAQRLPVHNPTLRGTILSNLASALWTLHTVLRTHCFQSISEIIDLKREGLSYLPQAHPERAMGMSTLADLIHLQMRMLRRISNDPSVSPAPLESMELHRAFLESGHQNYGRRCLGLVDLAVFFNYWHHVDPKEANPEIMAVSQWVSIKAAMTNGSRYPKTPRQVILELLRQSANLFNGEAGHRLRAASVWRKLAREFEDESEMEAAEASLNLLDEIVTRSTSVEAQYHELGPRNSELRDAVQSSTEVAIQRGDLQRAVTLLEQGRGVIFKHLGRYRTELGDLRAVAPELAERFQECSRKLNNLMTQGEAVLDGDLAQESRDFVLPREETILGADFTRYSREDRATKLHLLSETWNTVVREIRDLEGFKSFLLPLQYSELQHAASGGPIVIINVGPRRSDAIIVRFDQEPLLVPLPEVDGDTLRSLVNRLGSQPAAASDAVAALVLTELWRTIVAPVVEQLLAGGLKPGSRIWWCPTGAAAGVPLHAAGPYISGEKKLPNIFISSYTPTLSSLIRARKGAKPLSKEPELLLVAQPATPGQDPLSNALKEAHSIRRFSPDARIMEGQEASRNAVLGILEEHHWLHLVCHGHSVPNNPFLSNFSLHDGPLSLRDVIEKNLPRAEFAYLSACHSAKTTEDAPDEVLHLTAGMMFSGYRSVVGTMWALDDSTGSIVAEEFYRLMLGHPTGPKNCSKAAIALAKAVEKLPAYTPLAQRINFVHFGI